jgi:hypothetical protein
MEEPEPAAADPVRATSMKLDFGDEWDEVTIQIGGAEATFIRDDETGWRLAD